MQNSCIEVLLCDDSSAAPEGVEQPLLLLLELPPRSTKRPLPDPDPCDWRIHNGFWYCLPPDAWLRKSQPPVRAYRRGEEWEKASKDVVRALRPLFLNTIAVTAGLYFGDWLPILSAAVGRGGRVFGYEPVESSFPLANETLVRNRLQNVQIEMACISNTSLSLPMCTVGKQGHPRAAGAAMYASINPGKQGRMRGKQCGTTSMVPCHTLDEVLPWRHQRVGLLHLDVEGHEGEAVLGARTLIQKHRPVIASEGLLLNHGRSKGRALGPSWGELGWLNELGYSQVCNCDELHWYRVDSWTSEECVRLPPCCGSCRKAARNLPSAAVIDVVSGVDGLSANAARKTAASQRSGASARPSPILERRSGSESYARLVRKSPARKRAVERWNDRSEHARRTETRSRAEQLVRPGIVISVVMLLLVVSAILSLRSVLVSRGPDATSRWSDGSSHRQSRPIHRPSLVGGMVVELNEGLLVGSREAGYCTLFTKT